MAARIQHKPTLLEPMSNNSLNLRDGNGIPPLKKRKTFHNDYNPPTPPPLCQQTISIRAHSASLSDEPYILDPITILPRSRVPFSWLDTTTSLSQIQSGSLFVAYIPSLEGDEYENGNEDRVPANVLVARLRADGDEKYVLERVKRGIYSLCKLGSWVGEGDVVVLGKTALSSGPGDVDAVDVSVGVGAGESEWWEAARVDDMDPGRIISAKKRSKLDVSFVFGPGSVGVGADTQVGDESGGSFDSRRRSMSRVAPLERSSSSDVNLLTPLESSQGRGDVSMEDAGASGCKTDGQQSPQELLDSLREQYLQALYISKTSVAYFAKGPLSRCRTAFQSSDKEDSKPADLIGFYREAILNAKKMDLKYRETLPANIREVAITISEDEAAPHTKKRKSRKKKLGKNGLYPEEEEFIRKWWKDRSLSENGLLIETSRESESKRHIGDLRLRETQLQILLILEAIALESAAAEEAKKANENGEKSMEEAPKPKSKKSQDLNVLLELHLDRLCIWHAVNFEEATVPDSVKASDSHLSGKKVESDALRDFCTEVVIPFYASRLPDKCKLITRKFGVSGKSSSHKQPSHSKRSSRTQPGSTVRQEQPQKSRRSLHRVLTDEQSTSRARPSLPRSNTTPAYPDAKRESMEPLLPTLGANIRGGIQKAKRVENRVVDLNAAAREHEAKLKKVQALADQKKELDAAIHALRKPNRELVAKDIANDAEKRISSGSSRKQKNPVRNPLGQGVQVMATPKGHRKKDVGLPPPKSFVRTSTSQDNSSPFGAGDPQFVPASAIRPRSFPVPSNSRVPDSDTNQGDIGTIQETPSKHPPQPSRSAIDQSSPAFKGNQFRVPSRPAPRSTDVAAPSTPVSSRRINLSHLQQGQTKSSMVMETPPKQNPKPPGLGSGSPAAVMATPDKSTANLHVPSSSKAPVTPEKSIYEQLGWDDDDELA
ncbi:hypothetical protein PHISCL_10029 [Aspergillus sclerotialis]|uniref:DNA replication regulator Sld3 C-terminal domain-containing protein n=1 Tax=Aspergillus sclerotialis TaxID=2070753 RepID=A0A3A2Z619_9EURO|nr:hypothetical protein PHISCL_10029 [Aspergillus sclerotialis]